MKTSQAIFVALMIMATAIHAESGSDAGYFFTVKNDTAITLTLSMQRGGDNFYSPQIEAGKTWVNFCGDTCIIGVKNREYFAQEACNLCGRTISIKQNENGTFYLQ